VTQVVRSGQLFAADEVKAFEREFAQYQGSSQAFGIGNATQGLHLALAALNVGDGPTCQDAGDLFMTIPLQSRYFDEAELRAFGIWNVGTNVRVSQHATFVGLQNIYLGSNIRIDSHVVIVSGRATLTVGNNVYIEPASSIVTHFGVEIGNYCTISHGVRLFTASADYSGEYFTNIVPDSKYQEPKGAPIIIHDHVIVGGNSVVMPGTEIGEGAAIGALSFVRHSIDGWAIYGGNPLKRIGDRKTHIRDLAARIEAESVD